MVLRESKTAPAGPLFFAKFVKKVGQISGQKVGFRPIIFGREREIVKKLLTKLTKNAFPSKKVGQMAKYFFVLGREKCSIINGLRAFRPVVQFFFYYYAKKHFYYINRKIAKYLDIWTRSKK